MNCMAPCVRCLVLAPVPPRRPDQGIEQADIEVGRDQQADGIELFAGFWDISSRKGSLELCIRRNPQMQEDQDHDPTQPMHDVIGDGQG